MAQVSQRSQTSQVSKKPLNNDKDIEKIDDKKVSRRKVKLPGREVLLRLALDADDLANAMRHFHIQPPIKLVKRYPVQCAMIALIVGAVLLGFVARMNDQRQHARQIIASFFTSEVQYWSPQIEQWAGQYGLDPQLIATIMQIESCGLADAVSNSGAQGLFQVMPMHFSAGEAMTEPDTNARHGMAVLQECLRWSNANVGLALACYNGGPALINRPFASWPAQSQRYYIWGVGIYSDAQKGLQVSPTLNTWLAFGGVHLCERASAALPKS